VPGPYPNQLQDIGGCVDLTNYPAIFLPAGVTIRGGRRGTNFGPQLYQYNSNSALIFDVSGDYVRVTGLRLRGQSRSTDYPQPGGTAIQVGYPASSTGPTFNLTTTTEFIAAIDHNDVSDWTSTAINSRGPYPNNKDGTCQYPGEPTPEACSDIISFTDPTGNLIRATVADDPATLPNVHVARNFIHHNQENNLGYGVGTSSGGRALVEGNTFAWNRHAIASDAEPHDEYRAAHNLVLSDSSFEDQDFDMHGSDGGYGGTAGFYVDIVGNTFLATNRSDYWLRGEPAFYTDFHRNVSLRDSGGAVTFHTCGPPFLCINGTTPINVFDNQFADSSPPYTDPTIKLGPASLAVGDFDGDGDDDLFLATGNTWFYSPAGAREWRFLNAAPDTVDQLLFGNFDGDGRTDVVAMRNGQLVVSWGGISAFDVLNYGPLPCSSMSDMAVGDFDGDGHPDIFCADGTTWWVSFGGNTAFVPIQTSSFRVANLGFGDFNGDGTTDVIGVVGYGNSNYYQASFSPRSMPGSLFSGWTPLQPALTNSVASFMIADFNGDGIADILAPSSDGWQISYGGSQPWTDVPQPLFAGSSGSFALLDVAGVGHFTGQRQADIVVWNGTPYIPLSTGVTELLLSAAGVSPATAYSTQDMR
jgi:hypothetical protein